MSARSGRWAGLLLAMTLGGIIGYGCRQADPNSTAAVASSANAKSDAGSPDAAAPDVASEAKNPQRLGCVIGLKPEKKDYYNKLHAHPWPEINAMLKAAHVQNYSIYEGEVDGKLYLFAYMEYTGDDFDADMKRLAADPKTQEWWKETDPCQIRLPGTPDGEQWLKIPEVYHLD